MFTVRSQIFPRPSGKVEKITNTLARAVASWLARGRAGRTNYFIHALGECSWEIVAAPAEPVADEHQHSVKAAKIQEDLNVKETCYAPACELERSRSVGFGHSSTF